MKNSTIIAIAIAVLLSAPAFAGSNNQDDYAPQATQTPQPASSYLQRQSQRQACENQCQEDYQNSLTSCAGQNIEYAAYCEKTANSNFQRCSRSCSN